MSELKEDLEFEKKTFFDWGEIKQNIKDNLTSGVTVAMVSIPLSTALAISSGA